MEPLTARRIRGNWATILLPIDRRDRIDFSKLGEQIDYLCESGVDGIYANGTTGEFYNQTDEEFLRIATMLAERCNQRRVAFQIGISHFNPTVTLERVRQVKPLAPSAFQVILPDWFPPTVAESIEFLRHVASVATPIGLVLYNPPHAKRVMTPSELGQLAAEVPGLVGVKVADGGDEWYAEMRACVSRLSVFVPGHHLATGVARGASGSYSNVACLSPRGAQRWTEMIESDLSAALAVEARLRSFMAGYMKPLIVEQGYSNQAVDKLLASIGGWSSCGTRLRWPYRWIDENVVEELRVVTRRMLPEFVD